MWLVVFWVFSSLDKISGSFGTLGDVSMWFELCSVCLTWCGVMCDVSLSTRFVYQNRIE